MAGLIKCIKCSKPVEEARTRIFGASDPSGRTCAACAAASYQRVLEKAKAHKQQQLSFGLGNICEIVSGAFKRSGIVYVRKGRKWVPKEESVGKPQIDKIYD